MTMDEIRASGKETLTPADIAGVLHADQHTIRLTARNNPSAIKFPFTFIGTRMKIPRIGFIKWMEGGTA